MTKKIALFALALVSAAQADTSCDVSSRLYGGIGLGFSNAHAPILKNKGLVQSLEGLNNELTAAQRGTVDFGKANLTTSRKKMRAFATRLALGGHFLVPNTCLVLGAEASFSLLGSKGQIKQNLESTNIVRNAGAAAVNAQGSYSCTVRDRWNMAFTGIVGAKVARFLPYAKVGVAIHSFKTARNDDNATLSGALTKAVGEPSVKKSKKALFVMGLGAEYNVTKNIIMGAEWTHHRGSLGLLSKADRKEATKQEKKMDKIRTNEFMVTCKYAFPVN